jgi:hypothetical protein
MSSITGQAKNMSVKKLAGIFCVGLAMTSSHAGKKICDRSAALSAKSATRDVIRIGQMAP